MKRKSFRKITFYERYIKRPIDFYCALLGIIVLSPVLIVIAILVRIKLGSPVIFKQQRPGFNEKIFTLYKFRTMTDQKDESGNLLPDEVRLTRFGAVLRNSSLDELPELFNILNGDMAVIGPRPQLVRDMVFMTKEQRRRHLVRPGLSGLAQINGRNAISWENKLNYDLQYIEKITFLKDATIILQTVIKAFIKQEGITEENMASAEDLGDHLLKTGVVSKDKYDRLQMRAKELLEEASCK
ncbi:MAG: sugar transferase [Lachnospiraceae bacterium]|nr:sugar transferase [Lachnospiraceae bacterium]